MKSKILLLEDDLNLSETVCEYFEEQGFEVICVYNGDEAICAIYENSFDLLLLDVNVPNKNGFEVLKEVRKENNNVPAIFTTSLNSMDSLEEGYLSGCDDYIRKPFELKELLFISKCTYCRGTSCTKWRFPNRKVTKSRRTRSTNNGIGIS